MASLFAHQLRASTSQSLHRKKPFRNLTSFPFQLFFLVVLSLGLTLSSCEDDESVTGGTVSTRVIATAGTSSASLSQPMSVYDPSRWVTPGQASEAQLESLKYLITNIEICETMTPDGTGWSNSQNCIPIYSNPSVDCGTFGFPEAEADTTNYIDLMNPTDRSRLDSSVILTQENVRTYSYGIIGWCYPIKIKATVSAVDGSTIFYTKPGTRYESQFGSTTLVTSLTAGPAEEGITVHDNGGSWFRFQNPFEITADDISNKTNFSLDLVFNPANMISGAPTGMMGGDCPGNFTDALLGASCADGNRIFVPFLRLTPIFHAASDTVEKETYLFHIQETGHKYDVRVGLYYLSSDLNKTIYGVDTKTNYTSESIQLESDPPNPFSLTSTNGTISLKDYTNTTYLTFSRLSAVGVASTTATFFCDDTIDGGFAIGPTCPSPSIAVNYELAEIATVSPP